MAWALLPKLWLLSRSVRWSEERIGRVQARLTADRICDARAGCPFYADLYRDLPPVPDALDDGLATLPIVRKADVKANFPDRIVHQRADPASCYPVATSGTVDRVMLLHDEAKRDWDRAADLLLAMDDADAGGFAPTLIIPPDACYERCGLDADGHDTPLRERFARVITNRDGSRRRALRALAAAVMRDWIRREQVLPAFGVDGTGVSIETLDGYLRALEAQRVGVLRTLPTYAVVLAARLRDLGRRLRIPVVRPAGAKLTPKMIERVERRVGLRVRENYGCTELGTIATDCEGDRRQHLLSLLYRIEFVRGGVPVAPGELGEIVLTDLRNRVAPLIRYAIGDVGVAADGVCGACGRTGTRFTVKGRLDETLVTPAGRAVAGDDVVDAFLADPRIEHVSVAQRGPDRFRVELVAATGAEAPSPQWCEARLSHLLEMPVRADVRRVERIAPERSGKFRFVHSTSFAAFHAPPARTRSVG